MVHSVLHLYVCCPRTGRSTCYWLLTKYTYSTSTLKAVSLHVDARPSELPHRRLLSGTTTETFYRTIVVAYDPGSLRRKVVDQSVKYPERTDCVSSDAADTGNTYASGGRLVLHSLSYETLTVGNRTVCRSYGVVLIVSSILVDGVSRIPRFGH